jgi:hypothetical protein
MAERLGGEIGVEQDAQDIRVGYDRLRRQAPSAKRPAGSRADAGSAGNRPSITPAPQEPDSRQTPSPNSGEVFPWQHVSVDTGSVRYADRVRMDFTAARVEHQQKTLAAALASLVHPIIRVPDYVHPRFLLNASDDLVGHVKRLVRSVRDLLGFSRRLSWRLDRSPRVHALLATLRDWDHEALQALVYRAQERGRVTFAQLEELTRLLYRPMVQFHGRVDVAEVSRVLELAYRERARRLPKSSRRLPELRHSLNTAISEAEIVFETLKHRCYPLLMKVATVTYRPAERFFDEALPELMRFTNVSESDRVPEPSEAPVEAPEGEAHAGPSSFVVNGLRLLDRLFPRAGWDRINWQQAQQGRAPDLYAYYACLLDYPAGFELVPPSDPVMPAITLWLILGELFGALSTVHFTTVPGTNLPLAPVIAELTAHYGAVNRGVIGDDYLRKVRELADLRRYGGTDSLYARRVEAEARAIRREYVVPWAPVSGERRVALDGRAEYPLAYELVEQLADLLLRVALDITESADEDAAPQSVANPWERPAAPVDNQVVNRVRIVTRWNHANLLLVVASVTAVLDHLLNEVEGAWPAELATLPLYRTASDGSPETDVAVMDAATLMRLLDDPAVSGVQIPGFQSRSVLPLAISTVSADAPSTGLLVIHVDGAAELWAESETELVQTVERVDRLVVAGSGAPIRHRILRAVDSLVYLCEPAADRYHAAEILRHAARAGVGLRLGIVERFDAEQAEAAAGWIDTLVRALASEPAGTLIRLDSDDGRLYTERDFR